MRQPYGWGMGKNDSCNTYCSESIAKEQKLADEQLQPLMTESEKIINDRPITPVSGDPNEPPALTPSMLLLMKSNSSIPQDVFVKEDIYSKR